MYAYIHDPETGGLLLTNTITDKSNEPRPVYAKELDILGINKFWKYRRQNNVPYMWAEANKYYYRGDVIFTLSGGSLYEAPEVVIAYKKDENGETTDQPVRKFKTTLKPVDLDAMIQKNSEQLAALEQFAVKDIYKVYRKFQDKLDCFHVAFSGGKDSVVLLHLVKKALPKSSFIVVFGDTKMEFPDTYKLIDKVEKQCKAEKIEFYRATSHLDPQDSWRIFGPPSRVLRWCCSVHKSVPQILKIRELTKKNEYTGMDFVGVRAFESLTRSKYTKQSFSGKQKGQYSYNAIIEWSSAEVWLYLYTHNLPINNAYKGGLNRVGCLYCPMGGGKGDFFQYSMYHDEIQLYIDLILDSIDPNSPNYHSQTYITEGGWNARKNGRDLANNAQRYTDDVKGNILSIELMNPCSSPEEWSKILGIQADYLSIKKKEGGYSIVINNNRAKLTPSQLLNVKKAFRKAAYCIGCKTCEANCRRQCISFKNGLRIDDCVQCGQCQDIDDGCLLYHSRVITPQQRNKAILMTSSVNCFQNHGPKAEWISLLLSTENKAQLLVKSNPERLLGPNQIAAFARFLKGCGFHVAKSSKKTSLLTPLYELLKLDPNSPDIWGVALANLVDLSQTRWYITNMDIGVEYPKAELVAKLSETGLSKADASSVIYAFRRICEMQLGQSLNFGTTTSGSKGKLETLTRTKCYTPNPLVLLYALYRYAEACEGYYQFTLSTLLNEKAESAGVSPVKIFGYTREELRRQIEGLSARYPEFIGCSFTHDLEVVNLRPEKKSGWEEYSQPAPENDAERAAFQKNVEMKNTVLDLFYERD